MSLSIIESVLLEFYAVLLRLYPRQFRQDFAAEMHTVFGDALGCARREGLWTMLQLCSREVRELPGALVREHWQSAREKESSMAKSMQSLAGTDDASPVSAEMPVRSWREICMAMLPFVLLLLVDVLPTLLVEIGLLAWNTTGMNTMSIILALLMIGTILVIFFWARHRKWPAWSATWYSFFAAVPLMLASWLLSLGFMERINSIISQQGTLLFVGVPLMLAVLLYTTTRRDPLRGLLASLPVLYLLWMLIDMEFVPGAIGAAMKISSIALVCLATAFLLRQGNWRTGLYAILAMNLAVGILFSYVGIYHGGTLPSSAIGPNWVEVARSLVPPYLVGGAILLGPLFARKIRQVGRSHGPAGQAGYHLALAGLLLVILANLMGLTLGMDSPSGRLDSSSHNILVAAIGLGLGLYLVSLCCLFFLFRDTPFFRTAPGWALRDWAPRLLLVLLPLAIPVIFILPFISWEKPIYDLYGTPLLWELPHTLSLSIGLVWLALSVWMVTQRTETAKPTAAVGG